MKYPINKLKTKATTLAVVQKHVKNSSVPKFLYFRCDEYHNNKEAVLNSILKKFDKKGSMLAIRSSAVDEDQSDSTCAGEYHTELNVSASNEIEICSAIDLVISSYTAKGKTEGDNEFIVQEMLQNTIMSGVVFTYDLNTGAPYYVINYDDISGLTNTVTSGDGEYSNRTLYIHRGATSVIRSERFQKLVKAVQELESITGSQFLDIEFALDDKFTPYIFQVRAISTMRNWNRAVSKKIDLTLKGIQEFVRERFKRVPGVFGKTTVLGQMPDWNPAEMIGRAPRALAFSLYKILITDHSWRIAREKMGYAIPTGQPLMLSLAGQPFIDTRLSFHSYLPGGLEEDIGEKLVDAWVAKLCKHPELHDKVEFDVAITAYGFDIDKRIEEQIAGVLNEEEKKVFRELIKSQTRDLLENNGRGSINLAVEKINELVKKQKKYCNTNTAGDFSILFGMVEDCIRLGTIPFSILARHGFIAKTLLSSLETCNIITREDADAIQASAHTVASEIVTDMRKMREGTLSRESFMSIYGHLRPGTYDILSLRYDQVDEICSSENSNHCASEIYDYKFSERQETLINEILDREGFVNMDANGLLEYIKESITSREYGKFVFSKTVSDMLEIVAEYGERYGLSREEMSHIPLQTLLDIETSSEPSSIEDRLRCISQHEEVKHALSYSIRLPQVLFDEAGVHIIPFQVSHPNFITNKKITAASVLIEVGEMPISLAGKIVLIENADPGFDWIFGHPIAGLVTKYGGVNSHMAIRCAEFGIPAAIGCGEQRFEMLRKMDKILLDCVSSNIQAFH